MKKSSKFLTVIISALVLSGCSLGKHVHEWSTFVKLDDESHYKVCKTDKSHSVLEPHHFVYVGPYLDYTDKDVYRCEECGFEKITQKPGNFTKEVVDKKFLFEKISSATSIYYKSDENGRYGDPLAIFMHTTLPSEYKEVKYIESRGGNHFDTGISLKSGDKMKIKFDHAGGYLFGQVDSFDVANNPYYVHTKESDFSLCNHVVVKEEINDKELSAEFVDVDSIKRGEFTLFGCHENLSMRECVGRIYSFQYYRNDQLIRDYVPCYRISDHKGGFYDLANNKFVTSKGAQYFSGGDIVSNELIDDKYYETEYTESFGYQYVNTGVNFTPTTKIVTDLTFDSHPSYNFMFGNWSQAQSVALCIDYKITACNGSGSPTNDLTGSMVEKFSKHHMEFVSGSGITFDEQFFQASNPILCDRERPIYMFAASEDTTGMPYRIGWGNKFGAGRIYNFKIYNDSVLVRDFIPVVTKNLSAYGMYDKVEGKFYENEYSKPLFEVGPTANNYNLPEGYTELEYIEANGEQYIDTNLIFDPTTDSFDIWAQSTKTNQSTMIFASHDGSDNGFYFYHENSASGVYFSYLSQSNTRPYLVTGIKPGDFALHHYHYDCTGFIIDGTSVPFASPVRAKRPKFTAALFGAASFYNSQQDYSFYGKLYGAAIYSSGVLKREFVPCISPNNLAGLYDIVGKKFYTDDRSGVNPVRPASEIETTMSLGIEKEPTYSEHGQEKILDLLTGEISYKDIDNLSYKVAFSGNNVSTLVYERGNKDKASISNIAYSYNVNSLNYSKINSMVMFKPIPAEGYEVSSIKVKSGSCTMREKDGIYYIEQIATDLSIEIVTEMIN